MRTRFRIRGVVQREGGWKKQDEGQFQCQCEARVSG